MANSTVIAALTPRLMGFVAQARALGVLSHPGIKGRLRELIVKDLIEPFLPPSLSVETGVIVTSEGQTRQRNQDDLVLFSRERAPMLLEMEQCLLPIEGVFAQVEVKSILTRQDVRDAVSAATELRDYATGSAPAGLIFAYESDNTSTSEADRLLDVLKEVGFKATPGQATSPIQVICIAERGTWVLASHEGKSGWWFVPPTDEHHLFAFASVISNSAYREVHGRRGVGSYLLDVRWLAGPSPECPVVV